jgi:DNA-binding NarL/FixJ family response regulator
LRVAIAEDTALFRQGLASLLEAAGHEIVAVASNGDTLVRLLESQPADAAILDIRMPPGDTGGIITGRRLREVHPQLGLLFLSLYADGHYLMRILELDSRPGRLPPGAVRPGLGYRLKDRVGDVGALSDNLHRILAGEIVIEPDVARRMVEKPQGKAVQGVAALTPSQVEVLRLMAEGRSNAGIAVQLNRSTKTIENRSMAIFAQLGLSEQDPFDHRRVLAVLAYLRAQNPDP